MVLKLSKKCIFCNLVLTSARNLSVLKQSTYMNQNVFITVSQKMTCSFVKKDKIKILISDQIAFAAVVYFGQVFGFCRLINKSVLKWFLLIMCLNNAYSNKIYPFSRNHPTLLLIEKRRSTDATGDLLSQHFAIFTRKHVLR